MADREKVIAEFEDIQRSLNAGHGVAITDKSELVRDTLELLKEPEAVEPMTDNEGGYWCKSCYEDIVWHQKYCSNCGRSVKWDG